MRRFFLTANFLFLSFLCIAQQNVPAKIIGKIPQWNSPKLYQIQVGAYNVPQNAEDAYFRLRVENLYPVQEKHLGFTRVILKEIPADEVKKYLTIIKRAGFNEVIIREDTSGNPVENPVENAIAEKWEINSPESSFLSFEFNLDKNYIVIENNDAKLAHFGKYSIPLKDMIILENFGIIAITENNEAGVSFSFSPADEPDKTMNFTAVKAKAIAKSPELDLFCRTWKVVDCTEKNNIGMLLFISAAGTYFFTDTKGVSNSLSHWRWFDDKREEFEYSHDNWEHYGRAKITDLSINSLGVIDPGYFDFSPGYSTAGFNNIWGLVPVNN